MPTGSAPTTELPGGKTIAHRLLSLEAANGPAASLIVLRLRCLSR